VEKLLRRGAYDIFNEDNAGKCEAESNSFIEQDIDSILQRRSRNIVHDVAAGGGSGNGGSGSTFSKARFALPSSSSKDTHGVNKGKFVPTDDVDVEDPDFWRKIVGEKAIQEAEAPQILAKGKRTQQAKNYSERMTWKQIDRQLSMSDSHSSDSESDQSEHENTEELHVERMLWGGNRVNEWKQEDVELLVKALMARGYPVRSFANGVTDIAGSTVTSGVDTGQSQQSHTLWEEFCCLHSSFLRKYPLKEVRTVTLSR
jgi:hypothetical protein